MFGWGLVCLEEQVFGASTPARYADCDPNENIWKELKEYKRKEVKPKTKQELIEGIRALWSTVDITKYTKYNCIKPSLK